MHRGSLHSVWSLIKNPQASIQHRLSLLAPSADLFVDITLQALQAGCSLLKGRVRWMASAAYNNKSSEIALPPNRGYEWNRSISKPIRLKIHEKPGYVVAGIATILPGGSDTSQYEGARRRAELLYEIVPANTRSAHE